MDAPAKLKIFHLLGVGLLLTFDLLTCVHSTGDVWFSLNGTPYQNNSLVSLEDIGGDNASLLCLTNFSACCGPRTSENTSTNGNWYLPNGSRVPSKNINEQSGFSRDRGQSVVRMYRRRGGVDGIYRCEIPDSMNVRQVIYIGVYTENRGSPNASNLTYNDQSRTLTCTSTGGPATTVTWRRDGVVITPNATHQQTKRVVDPVDGTYQTMLTIDPSVCSNHIVGTYNCTVENVRGESSETVVVSDTGDFWFSLRNTKYQNNSCVMLEDIGEGDDALLCLANLTDCHQPSHTDAMVLVLGNWFFLNGTTVPSNGTSFDFYSDRIEMVVRLNRRQGGEEGIYYCEIHDSLNVTQTIYIGVYAASTASKPTQPLTATAPVNSSIQPTSNTPSNRTTTTSVIIVVAAVIILIVVVVGVVILVVIFRAKKSKQQLETNKVQNVMTEKADIEMKLKQEGTTDLEASSNANLPPYYTEIQTKAPRLVPSKSEDLVKYLSQNNPLTIGYSEIELEAADSKHALPAKPPREVYHSDPMSEEKEPNPTYQNTNEHCDLPNTTNVQQENDIYTVPDATSSHTVESDNGTNEPVYSEPIQPSLFIDAVETPSDCEDLHPCAPIYTLPINQPENKEVLLKVFGSNIREIHELGLGQFGKVILAETVGLSAKDLRLSESDDDKSKSTLVAVKKLKSDAPNATKEAFEKEVKFMSRLTDRNVIHILGVCYENTPFIMMEYMEKGDLNQYLQKFKTLSTTDSEPQGQITASTLVHMATQIASAMKYLASHNYVHRDLATRNCLVGPNYLVKISDFGMSRSLYDSHYYRIRGHFALPIRWMAFECFYGKFSQKSDVWAFGIAMWEIFTLAKEQPYNDMSDKKVVEDALKGKNRQTLARPYMCPLEVYKIMLECWAHNSEQRKTFEQLFQLLISIYHNV